MGKNIISTLNIIVILIFYTACKSKEDNSKIDDEIVLKLGSLEITRYEYEKNKKKETEPNKYGNTKDWLNNYIYNLYFLADAYAQKYDTISFINKKVDYASITMLGQFKGYLWNKVEEPKLVFPKKEIKQIYKKQNKLFDLEYFLFPDKILFSSILNNDTVIRTEADFKNLINKCQTNLVKYINLKLLYPFFELEPAKERIYALKQGDILTIHLKNGKILVAHLKNVQDINQKKFKEDEENIYSNLKYFKENQIVEEKQYSIFSKANIEINELVAEKILNFFNNNLTLEDSQTFLADTVLRYVFNNQPNMLLVKDFFDYYHNNPFMFIIEDLQSLNKVLREIVEEKYLYEESVKLGIIKERKFILDKRDYMNRLIMNAYFQNNFDTVKVSEEQMFSYFNVNKQSLSQCKVCYVSAFIFKDKNSAFFNLNLINKIISQNGIKNPSDTSMIGLICYRPNDKIDKKNLNYPATILSTLYSSKINTSIGPFEVNDQVIIFIKTKEEGQEVPNYEPVKERIEKILMAKRIEMLKEAKLKELIKKYHILINKIQSE